MSSSRRAPLLVHLCALAVVSACKKPATAVPTQYDYAVFVPYSGAEVEGVELDGKPITKVDELARGTRFTAVVATADHAAQKPLQVVLKTSCGSTKVPGTLVFGLVKSSGAASEDQERAVVKPGDKVLSEVRYDAPPVVDVFVDVDGAEAAKVAVGALPLDKGKPPFRVALGACPTTTSSSRRRTRSRRRTTSRCAARSAGVPPRRRRSRGARSAPSRQSPIFGVTFFTSPAASFFASA